MTVIKARLRDHGVFSSSRPPANQPTTLPHVHVPDLPQASVQFYRLAVETRLTRLRTVQLVIAAKYPALTALDRDILTVFLVQRYPREQVTFILDDAEGSVEVDARATRDQWPQAAAAAAVVRYSCGWDESPSIRVTAGSVSYDARIQPQASAYCVTVERAAVQRGDEPDEPSVR